MKMRFPVFLFIVLLFVAGRTIAQMQACPVNINFSAGTLANWSATTGLVDGQTINYPLPNTVSTIPEYTLQTVGIRVNTTSLIDHFGKFETVPTVNGYAYDYSIQLGSSSTSADLNNGERNPGGFTRSVTYTIDVPPGASDVPYTMTYAYALVLENGTHNSSEQPVFKATLQTSAGVITCASPQYYLPTFNDASQGGGGGGGAGGGGGGGGSRGATLDSATAKSNGFTNSSEPFYSFSGQPGNGGGGEWLFDVWTKGWTEVTFDLSAYRGQKVTLTFESDNCRPGAHFAYAYVALRNTCAGLEISGPPVACTNATLTYSIPALAGATYTWTVPSDWTIISGANTNIITVKAGLNGGRIGVREVNSCADLKDTIALTTTPPTVAGNTNDDNTVCSGINSTLLTNAGSVGSILNWLQSPDGRTWTPINVTTPQYNALNLTRTTYFSAAIQNGSTCSIDTAQPALVTVDEKTLAGLIQPSGVNVCLDQPVLPLLELKENNGSVLNWQQSPNNSSWNNVSPATQQDAYQINSINTDMYYRAVVKNGVCDADTSEIATVRYFNTKFPSASSDPDSSRICFGTSALLTATINTGTSYSWSNPAVVSNAGGVITSLPFTFSTNASPRRTGDLVLTVNNAGCPNPLLDTFFVYVIPQVVVFAGNDTVVTVGQPMQFNALTSAPGVNQFNWSPGTGLNNAAIANPVGNYKFNDPASITYNVKVTTGDGCEGSDNITIKVFKTGADIFVPSAFTPNNDGKNDKIMPIAVGIQQLRFFRVYNRWGQLVYSTSSINSGWDGRIGGATQNSGTFVYMVEGVDYTGQVIVKKGSFVLLR